ncbi:MAG: N-acetylmuramoyl-L-alanine amidase [Bacteroidetes bacterium]|uniref:N-acetylmuramoyl-L-alanine amidase n=1 Tax=Candidatus Pullibacteroides excrementavium TaxID=2840905 RepID=A0A9D9H0C2_9BACT|nr:N-acetylmuramoyl-L-alanine amidase [Candidatus Pullibacteroides excrementavium]
MRYWRILLSVFFSLAVAMTVQAQVVPDKVDVLVIDPGHGGKDPGCHGKTTLEKDVVLSVSKKFGKLVQEKYPDVKVVYTRSDDRFIELWRRGQIANDNHADLFVSIHCNAVDNPSAKGTETWLRGSHKDAANLAEVQRENAVIYQEQNHEANYSQSWLDVVTATVHQDAGFENSIYFADELQSLYKSRIPSSPNRGIKQGGLYVLWKSARPSVLTELGFLSNPAEEKFLASEAGQNKVAQCLLDAFSKYKERIDSRVAASLASGDDSSESSVSGKEFGSSSVEAGDSEFRSESSAPDAASSSKIVFKVQIAASSRQLELKPYNFNGLSDLSRSYDASRKLYKYYYSSASSYSQIEKALQKAKKAGYGSAFIVAFEDGRSIAVDKAREKAGR